MALQFVLQIYWKVFLCGEAFLYTPSPEGVK